MATSAQTVRQIIQGNRLCHAVRLLGAHLKPWDPCRTPLLLRLKRTGHRDGRIPRGDESAGRPRVLKPRSRPEKLLHPSAGLAVSASTTGSPGRSTDPTGWRTRPAMFRVPTCGSTCVPCAGPRGPGPTPSASVRRWIPRTTPCTSSPNARATHAAQKAGSSIDECDSFFICIY